MSKNPVKQSVGAPNGSQNGLSHGIVAFKNERRRKAKRGRSLIDRRTAAGRNAVAVRDEILGDLGGAESLAATKLVLVELIARDVYFADEIDRRIFHTMYKVNRMQPEQKKYGVKGLATLYGYRQTVVNNLSRNLQALGLEKAPPKVKSLAEILEEDEESP